jgi:glutamate/aspartate transport system permease protein
MNPSTEHTGAFTWDWAVFCRSTLDQSDLPRCLGTPGEQSYLDWMVSAWGWTLTVSVWALALALALGLLVGVMRTTTTRWAVWLGDAWTELFRNIPVLVQVFLWYFVVPEALPLLKSVPGHVLVVFALGFYTSARISEQVKAGLLALPRGQRQAALALGLSPAQAYRHVLLPVSLRIVIPPLTSEAMSIVKNSSVAFAVSVPELILFARQAQEETSRGIEIYLAVTLAYAASSLLVFALAWMIERWVRVPGVAGAPLPQGRA